MRLLKCFACEFHEKFHLTPFYLFIMLAPQAVATVLDAPPASPAPDQQYLIYLHGSIVTGSDGKPVSTEFGTYEYREILNTLSNHGFTVISEIRDDDSDIPAIVGRVIDWIDQLKKSGVPSEHISVVGASIGGYIAARVSNAVTDPAIGYVLIASMYRIKSLPPFSLNGRVLTIHDRSDDRDWIPEAYFTISPNLTARDIIITDTGLGHGLLYTPHPAWINPTVDWNKSTDSTIRRIEEID